MAIGVIWILFQRENWKQYLAVLNSIIGHKYLLKEILLSKILEKIALLIQKELR